MRLAQIARKVQTTPTQIIKHIEQNFETVISSAPNTKIPEEYIESILDHFGQKKVKKEDNATAPVQPRKQPQSEPQLKEEKNPTPSSEEDTVASTNEAIQAEPSLEQETEMDETKELNIEDGVIKAPKVEVQGIKVVDKIELPTKKEEEEETEETEKDSSTPSGDESKKTTSEEPETKPKKQQKKKKQARKSNTTSFEDQQKKEDAAYEKELKLKREREKKKKKSHYEKMMKERQKNQKHRGSKKTKSQIKKANNEQKAITNQTEEKPKTAWGKFIKWLNT